VPVRYRGPMDSKPPSAELQIGVTGYSAQPFDRRRAQLLLGELLDEVEARWPGRRYVLVSGWTDVGVPSLAYREAARRGWRTVGVACALARGQACFPVDEVLVVGERWGDESAEFLGRIDVLVRLGGGPQAHREAGLFPRPVLSREL
jgi:hypothetical protein